MSWESVAVLVSHVEETLVVWSDALSGITILSWPLIIVKLELKNLGLEQCLHANSLVDELYQVVVEQVGVGVVVLVLNDVVNHEVNCSDLIVLKGLVNGRLAVLVLVEHWEICLEVFFVFVAEQ